MHNGGVALQTSADLLQAFARPPGAYSFETTPTLLGGIRGLRGEIADDVCALRAMSGVLSAAENARANGLANNLGAVSTAVGRAIMHFNDRLTKASLYQPGYQSSVDALYESASALRRGGPPRTLQISG